MVPGTGPGVLSSGDPGRLLAGTQKPVSCLGSGGIQYLSIFFPNSIYILFILFYKLKLWFFFFCKYSNVWNSHNSPPLLGFSDVMFEIAAVQLYVKRWHIQKRLLLYVNLGRSREDWHMHWREVATDSRMQHWVSLICGLIERSRRIINPYIIRL